MLPLLDSELQLNVFKLETHLYVQCIYLKYRFHVVVHLSSNRQQMTSKCGNKKKVAQQLIAKCVIDVPHFDIF